MHKVIRYALFFIFILLLQVFLFNNLNLSVYVYPMIYISFILLLPMQAAPVTVLALGLLTGVSMDLLSGTGGLHTIASLATAFLRPYVLMLMAGKEEVKEGGMPSPQKMGSGKFVRYTVFMVLLHCLVFFVFEAPGWEYLHLTMIRVAASAATTSILVFITQMLTANFAR